MSLLNFAYLLDYFQAGLPAGMDSSGHFAISQLYFSKHWPALDGHIEEYFQGFNFPRFYPPLFYQLCGVLFYCFPDISREVLFKIFVIMPCLSIPGLVAAFYQTFSKRFSYCLVIIFISSLLMSSDDEISRYMTGIKENVETGLCTQALGLNLLIVVLILLFSKRKSAFKYFGIPLFSTAFFLSNIHVVIFGCTLLTIIFCLGIFVYKKKYLFPSLLFAIGFLPALPWYLSAWLHRHESPTIPVENFNFSQMLLGYVLISMSCNLIVLVCQKSLRDRLSLFCVSALIALPILSVSVEPLGLRLPWQPHRLFALHNSFLALYLVNALRMVGKHIPDHKPWMAYRAKVASLTLLALFMLAFSPVRMQIGALNKNQSDSIRNFNRWLSTLPDDKGYSLVAFSESDKWIDEFDIALSHYLALSGQNGLWSVFRESSFNSIQATVLRNLISSKIEQWGIPNHNIISKKRYNLRHKLKILSYWGVRRVVVRTANYKKLFYRTGNTEIEYQDSYITSVKISSGANQEMDFERAVFFVSDPISDFKSGNFVDFAKLAEYTSLLDKVEYPVLLFRSCNELSSKISSAGPRIACSKKDSCCTDYVKSPTALYNVKLANPIKLKVYNLSPSAEADLVATPWRRAKEYQN